jgi:hypothetical protein
MSSRLAPSGVVVDHLRARGTNVDRLRVTRLLAAADIRPRRMPASAILCVRSFRGRLPLRPSADWERSVADSLEQVWRTAARPVHGPVPAAAEAVLFADEAELLACLASDASRGTLDQAWWWRGLGLRGPTMASVAAVWLAAAEYVPAALVHLAAAGELGQVLQQVASAMTWELVTAIVDRFGLTELAVRLNGVGASDQGLRHGVHLDQPSQLQPLAGVGQLGSRRSLMPPPWYALAPEGSEPGLDPPRQLLAGVGLLLQRSPATVRSGVFAQAAMEWYVRALLPLQAEVVSHAPPGQVAPVLRRSASARLTHPWDEEAGMPSTETPGASPSSGQAVSLTSVTVSVPLPVDDATLSDAPRITLWTAPEPLQAAAIDTELGGAFFLVDLALALDWYADFTRPTTPGLPLPIWEFLALSARHLVGQRAASDQLWSTLAGLTGHALRVREPWARWLVHQIPFLRTELRGWLHIARRIDLGQLLCLHAAHLEVSDTRVDVHFALADHPIAIRRAGLDRDPGWVPAAGRFIAFHFD